MSLAELSAKLGPSLPLILLTTALLAGTLIAYRLWREVKQDDEPATSADLFSGLARAEDQMTDAEFHRVRALLIGARSDRPDKITPRTVPVVKAPEPPEASSPEPSPGSSAAPSEPPTDQE